MDIYGQIAEALRKLAGTGGRAALFTGEVKRAEGERCTVDIGGLEVPDVELTPADDGKGGKLVITPKAGSMVTVADLSGGEMRRLAVVQWGEVEKVEVSAESIELNGGENGGLVNAKELTERLNAVEKAVNALKQTFGTWTPVPQDGGASLKGLAASWAAQLLRQTQQRDIEDKKITH